MVWLLWPGLVFADTINVQSGEHGDFTRLVLTVPAQAEWALTLREKGVYDLVFAGEDHSFDTSTVYQLIDRERVAEVATEAPGVFRVTLGCDCGVLAFLHAERFVVLDVSENIPAASVAGDDDADVSSLDRGTRATIELPLVTQNRASQIMALQLNRLLQGAGIDRDFDLAEHISVDRTDKPERDMPVDDAGKDAPPEEEPTVFVYCPPRAQFLTRDWLPEPPFSEMLAYLRNSVQEQDGGTSEEATLALAQFHVANAMGVEAQVLLPNPRGDAARLVKAIADVIAGKSVSPNAFSSCGGFAFYAFIAGSRSQGAALTDMSGTEILEGFKGLNPVLQRFFVDEFFKHLRDGGYVKELDAAEIYWHRTAKGLVVDIAEEDAEEPSLVDLKPVRSDPALEHADLLAGFSTIEAAIAASEESHALVDAFVVEHRGTDLHDPFRVALIRSHAARESFEAAFALLAEHRDVRAEGFPRLYNEVLDHLVTNGGDIAFLKLALAVDAGAHPLPDPSGEIAEAFSARKQALGF